MMDVWKDLPETETNHDIRHLKNAYSKKAWQLPTIPDHIGSPNKDIAFISERMMRYSTKSRHDARIYELEPAEYTVMICAYPEKVPLKLIRLIFKIISSRKLMSQEDFSSIVLQRMSILNHSNNKTRNQLIILYKHLLEIKLIGAIS